MQTETIELARKLIQEESVSPADGQCQEIVAAYLAELGFETENRDGTPSQQRKQQIHKRTFKNLMSKYKNNSSTLGDALWLDASSFNGSGDLLLCGSYHLRQFNDDEFRSVLETKLLMNPTYHEQLGKHVNTRCESCDRDQFQHQIR